MKNGKEWSKQEINLVRSPIFPKATKQKSDKLVLCNIKQKENWEYRVWI